MLVFVYEMKRSVVWEILLIQYIIIGGYWLCGRGNWKHKTCDIKNINIDIKTHESTGETKSWPPSGRCSNANVSAPENFSHMRLWIPTYGLDLRTWSRLVKMNRNAKFRSKEKRCKNSSKQSHFDVINSRIHSSVKYRRKFLGLLLATCAISVLCNCLSWCKFVNTHLYHSRQLYNIHIIHEQGENLPGLMRRSIRRSLMLASSCIPIAR